MSCQILNSELLRKLEKPGLEDWDWEQWSEGLCSL